MTATVFVWEMGKTGVGHASMNIRGPMGAAYVSWWPAASTRLWERALHGIASSGLVHSLRRDKEEDGIPDWASRPIDDLDEEAIISWWSTLAHSSNLKSGEERAKSGHYFFLSNNCSTTVIRALLVGATPHKCAQIRLSLLESTKDKAEDCLSERIVGKVVGGYGTWQGTQRAAVELVVAKVKPPFGIVIAPFDVRYIVENVWR